MSKPHEQQDAGDVEVVVHGRPGIIPQQLMRSKQNTPIAKVIYGLLTTFKNPFPGQRWLADRVPCSRPTVISRLRELELSGWLTREQTPNRRSGVTDRYDIYLIPLPMSHRAQWVQDLKMSAEEIDQSSQRGLLDQIKSTSLTQWGLPKTRELTDKRKKKEAKDKAKETDANASGQAREDDHKQPPPGPEEGVSPPAQLENSGALTSDDDKREEFVTAIKADPPTNRVGYSRAICGLVRRTRWYDYVAKERAFDLAQFLARVVNKGFNGSDAPPPLVQLDRLLTSLLLATEIPRPEKDVGKAWPWYARRVQAIMEAECEEVPPFDFRWTHQVPGRRETWRDLLFPKIIKKR